MIRDEYDTIEDFTVDSKTECLIAHVARNKKYKKLKQTNASDHLVRYSLRSAKAVQSQCHT